MGLAADIMMLSGRDARAAVRRCEALEVVREVAEKDTRALVFEAAWARFRAIRKDLPVLASCPSCDADARTNDEIELLFGYRTVRRGETAKVYRQSHCRKCRTKGRSRGE